MIYIISPIVFKYSPFIQRSLLFMNHVNTQYGFNLSQPEKLDIKCTRLLRLHNDIRWHEYVEDQEKNVKVELGAWHILPQSSLASCLHSHQDNRSSIDDKIAFADSRPIVLYVHGNGGTRAGDHRSKMYKRLAYEHDYHIVAFDYRGYADSTYLTPTTSGLSSDANFMYRWLLKQPNVTRDRITVWGHSLGTAVAVRMVASLPKDLAPRRLVLEAPFDSLGNAIANHPFSAPFRVIPYFEYFFVEPVQNTPELNFDSLSHIGDIQSTPIMILHAEDDAIIPFKLGYNLYKKAAQTLGESRVKFVKISADHGFGHKHICMHDDTMTKVKHFIEE